MTGTLNIALTGGSEPTKGDSFEIMTFAWRSGVLTAVDGLTIGNGKRFEVAYGPSNLVLTVVPE